MAVPFLLACVLLAALPALCAAPRIEQARALFERGEYRSAEEILLATPDNDGAVYALAGRCYFAGGDFRKAVAFFEKAVAADPKSSSHVHWLGRAYGRRAETSSFLTAPVFAVKARRSFEIAIQLDPRNSEAMNDLLEYEIEAPGFLGGGLDKAAALADRIRTLDPVEYHYARAKIDEKQKKFASAEQHLRRASELAPKDPGRLVDLAEFLARRGNHRESDDAFVRARIISLDAPLVLFAQARTYIHFRRDIKAAVALLRKYLGLRLTPDDPPRREAEELLRLASRM